MVILMNRMVLSTQAPTKEDQEFVHWCAELSKQFAEYLAGKDGQ